MEKSEMKRSQLLIRESEREPLNLRVGLGREF